MITIHIPIERDVRMENWIIVVTVLYQYWNLAETCLNWLVSSPIPWNDSLKCLDLGSWFYWMSYLAILVNNNVYLQLKRFLGFLYALEDLGTKDLFSLSTLSLFFLQIIMGIILWSVSHWPQILSDRPFSICTQCETFVGEGPEAPRSLRKGLQVNQFRSLGSFLLK